MATTSRALKVGDRVTYAGKDWTIAEIRYGGFYFDWVATLESDRGGFTTLTDTDQYQRLGKSPND